MHAIVTWHDADEIDQLILKLENELAARGRPWGRDPSVAQARPVVPGQALTCAIRKRP